MQPWSARRSPTAARVRGWPATTGTPWTDSTSQTSHTPAPSVTDRAYYWNTLYCTVSPGQAVNGSYTKEVNNTCKYQDSGLTMVYWTYNATNPLPKCIRKYKESFNNFLSFLQLINHFGFENI